MASFMGGFDVNSNNIGFSFDASNNRSPNRNAQNDSAMFDMNKNNNNAHYQHDQSDLHRGEYRQEIELHYTPNIVRWMKSNYFQHIKGEQHTVLISGYDHCDNYYLQTINYGKHDKEQRIEVVADDQKRFDSEISDIQFADDQTAVIVTRNGQIQLIKLKQNKEYSQNVKINQEDEKFDLYNHHKWKLQPLSSSDNPLICYPNPSNKHFPAALTSVTVNTICGHIVASDECGYIYITDIDQQKSISPQSYPCSSSAINCIRFANSDNIASATMSGQLMLWDLRDLNKPCQVANLPKEQGSCMSLAVHPHRNNLFAAGTENGTIAIWDVRGNRVNESESVKIFGGHSEHTLVNDIKFLTNNSNSMNGLVTCGNDGVAQMFQREEDIEWKHLSEMNYKKNIIAIQEEKYPITSLDFYEQLSIVATCCDAQTLTFSPI